MAIIMSIPMLTGELKFPPVSQTSSDGILAMGGDVTPQRILLAYRQGIFPWYEENMPVYWYYPNPRFVLFPQKLRMSKTVTSLIKKKSFEITMNQNFTSVIENCKNLERRNQLGTWITNDLMNTFVQLHKMGVAHSVEVWQRDELVGGLYGIKMGRVFFGESMFSIVSNASRFGFVKYVQLLQSEGIQMIDCQVYTDYLASMGAELVPAEKFTEFIHTLIKQ
ncbi:MAG TPA: leucyl/phenylalanyl-tRNA--protein transferase [Ferruginibacter sp.]|jgi:leucyl/phenylalanyl-tRNA--protein transferase|nr:leucyl/phenylalanyl-tRNA--protein transferase [Ferruginibacter sp.]HMU25581.1 leucyl/phenylalanyl-tRNA--protein transferase [Ferruginibacter sp.]